MLMCSSSTLHRRRFLRKPNVAEASEQFGKKCVKTSLNEDHVSPNSTQFYPSLGQLAKELKQQDCPQYAAFCNLAMAR